MKVPMAQTIQSLIAASVDGVLRARFPDTYHSLCHAHAIVGANVISVVFNREYRPVAGMAVIDCGSGLVHLTDNAAFANPVGGAYHCWIESTDRPFRQAEVIDFSYLHGHVHARRCGLAWTRPAKPEYLWGTRRQVVVNAELHSMPASFGPGQMWVRETPQGAAFITRQVSENMNAYVVLTAEVLLELQRRLPADSRLLAPLMPARAEGEAIAA